MKARRASVGLCLFNACPSGRHRRQHRAAGQHVQVHSGGGMVGIKPGLHLIEYRADKLSGQPDGHSSADLTIDFGDQVGQPQDRGLHVLCLGQHPPFRFGQNDPAADPVDQP